MTEALHKAAQAVLDRWDSPQWEWRQHGPTADLMADLRAALAQHPAPTAQPVQQPEPEVDGWPLYSGLPPAQRQPLSDEQAEALIEASDGRWHDGEFRIDGPDLMRLLRIAAQKGKKL